MKKPLILFLLIKFSAFSQNYEQIDEIVATYPRFSKATDLATQIEKDFTTDLEKARATFFWLTKNIRYNLKEYYNPKTRRFRIQYASEEEKIAKLQAVKDQLVADMFQNKTGVCEEYAQAFKKVCDLLNIESEVVKGYTRTNSKEIGTVANEPNHAWNVVKIDGNWLILDATWAAGYNDGQKWVREFNPYFFDVPKDKIFKSHYPEESLWVLRFGRMTINEFYNQPIYTSTYLGLKTELLSPKTGIININSSKDIELEFENFNTNLLVFYSFKGLKGVKKPLIKTVGRLTTLSIENPKRNTDLILFINKEDALYFKVMIK